MKAGLIIAFAAMASGAFQGKEGEKDCFWCKEAARIKTEHEAGKMSRHEWVERRLEILEGEYYSNRLELLEEKEKICDAEHKAGKVDLGDVLETRLEVLWLRFTLRKIEEKDFRKHHEEICQPYKKWLKDQVKSGRMTEEEQRKRLAALNEP